MKLKSVLVVLVLSGCGGGGGGSIPGTSGDRPVAFVPSRSDPQCAINRLIDGDTLVMTCGAQSDTVQLLGFDAPEANGGCGQERRLAVSSGKALYTILNNADVIVPRMYGRDSRNRALIGMHVNGVPLSQLMTKAGVAVPGSRSVDWCE